MERPRERLRVAVVGLGSMGGRIAGRLLDLDYDVLAWNRSPAKTATLVERGAVAATTPADAAAQADVLITMVADPTALQAVTQGPTGIAAGATPSLTVIDMSTVGAAAVADLADALPEHTALLDAPVLGSTGEAETGSLTIFVGGSEDVVERSMELLSALGSPVHVGTLGSGQAAKLVANASLFGTVALVGEAVALARGLGLDADVAFEVLAATPLAAQAERRRAAIENASYPPRFRLALARKDADLISRAAARAGVELRLSEAVRSWLADAAAHGFDERDYTAVLATILGCDDSTTTD
jgi:3-hydroxyisobutyrate dehydrogenase-like beta-hydroxyacid dehydrogenase